MRYEGLAEFRAKGAAAVAKGPVLAVLAEDGTEVESTLAHHLAQGFRRIVVFGAVALPEAMAARVDLVAHDLTGEHAAEAAVNAMIALAPAGTWMAWVFNAEYLFFPFCEDRGIGELAAFCAEERRDSLLTYVVDLYAPDLSTHPDAVDVEQAHFDRTGYYALVRRGRDTNPKERQLDFFGGLRWRFEEHITYACRWHHNLTAAVCSFRAAKALRANPGSREAIPTFLWPGSARFDWSSRQLLDLGMIEPGQ